MTVAYDRSNALRFARKRANHSRMEWEWLKSQFRDQCLFCGASEPEIALTKDHIVPLWRGGDDSIDNIQPACGRCNSSKGTSIRYGCAWYWSRWSRAFGKLPPWTLIHRDGVWVCERGSLWER